MTHHLTDEQLGASRDGELQGSAAAAAASHLAGCEECRQRLAELASLDAALAGALEHDPGEAYFASFAERVASRIAADAAAAPVATPAAPPPASARGPAAWWNSPRRLAWAGGMIALVAVAALVTTLAREHGPQELANRSAPARELGAPQAPPPSPRADEALKSTGNAAGEDARRGLPARAPAPRSAEEHAPQRARAQSSAPVKLRDGPAGPQHVLEVRTLPNGEQEVVQHERQFAPAPLPAAQAPGRIAKPRAMPLGGRALGGGAAPAQDEAGRKLALAPQAAGPTAALQNDQLAAGTRQEEAGQAAPALAICGQVRDAQGRPAANALVTVVETGASATAGADGAFCVGAPVTGGTLSVLAVGYRPYRQHVTAAGASVPVAVTLAPVDVLTPTGELKKREGGAAYGYLAGPATARPSFPRRAAMDASAAALKTGTAAAWTTAAERWETVALFEHAAADAEPNFHVAEARVNAWLIGRTEAQEAAARKATQSYLEHAREGTARDIATGWARTLEH